VRGGCPHDARAQEEGSMETQGAIVTIAPEDRTLATLTHLSGLSGYIVPFAGVIVPIVIWMVKSENKVIAAIAKQAILLNVVAFVVFAVTAVLALTIILLPIAIVCWILLGIAVVVLPIVGALKANDGHYYAYPIVGVVPR
jgi:uncharacterized Tic20 family protein